MSRLSSVIFQFHQQREAGEENKELALELEEAYTQMCCQERITIEIKTYGSKLLAANFNDILNVEANSDYMAQLQYSMYVFRSRLSLLISQNRLNKRFYVHRAKLCSV